MKTVLKKNPMEEGGFRILSDDGEDITEFFEVTDLQISVVPGELTKVHMTCYPTEVEAEFCKDNLIVTDKTTDAPDGGLSEEEKIPE